MTSEGTMTAQSFWAFVNQPENVGRFFERIDGEIIELMPSNPYASKIALRIGARLLDYADANNLGDVSGEQGGYTLDADNTFAPDVAFISKQRQAAFPQTGFNAIPPDLAVEVVSPSDLQDPKRRIWRKLEIYQRNGVPLIWYVYPQREEVEVYRLGQPVQVVGKDGVLDGEDVLPGFRLALTDVFR